MYKNIYLYLALIFLPVAVFLLIAGTRAMRLDKRSEFGLKLALIVNTSLALMTGWVGCARANGDKETVTCYIPQLERDEPVPAEFNSSSPWSDLERAVVDLEAEISSGQYDLMNSGEIGRRIYEALEDLERERLLTDDELEVIRAYCHERMAYNQHVLGGATCYRVAEPQGRDIIKRDAVARATDLRDLYARGTLSGETYDAALSALEDELQEYTGDEDVSTVKWLLLDLADGVKYD